MDEETGPQLHWGMLRLNKFLLAWFVMRGLGVEGSLTTLLAVQALLHFILYVAPTPGGSGIAELSTGALMAVLLPTELLGPFTWAYRFFLTCLPATVGAFILSVVVRPRVWPKGTVRNVAATGAVLALMTPAQPIPASAQPVHALCREAPSRLRSPRWRLMGAGRIPLLPGAGPGASESPTRSGAGRAVRGHGTTRPGTGRSPARHHLTVHGGDRRPGRGAGAPYAGRTADSTLGPIALVRL